MRARIYTTREKHVKAQADDFVGRIKPIKKDIGAIAQGHHWRTFGKASPIVITGETGA